jgi:hypothetical protein
LRTDPRNVRAREKLTEYGVDLSDYPETVNVPAGVLEAYVGTYIVPDDPDEVLRFAMEGEELAVELGGRMYALYPTSTTRFKVVVVPVYVTFTSDEAGNVTGVMIDQAGETVEAFLVSPRQPGDAVVLAIRPERIGLAPKPGTYSNEFDVVVEDIAFLGDHLRVRAALGGAADFIIKIPNVVGHGAVLAGDTVRVGWTPTDCRALVPDPAMAVAGAQRSAASNPA